eukprot:TRINITY_DN190_c2_g1_i7.p1 TRINITY_DN190_c2_g1~~TRINITY_DN190_c2_g1_i7.p1  ORF type:complete len:295 (-),score=81.45 TRINITY_DN190_c2_g1_i7:46-930(-)
MIIPENLFVWMMDNDVIHTASVRKRQNNHVTLNTKTSTGLLNGSLVLELMNNLGQHHGIRPIEPKTLSNTKDMREITTYNWQSLATILDKYGIELDQELLQMIIDGDTDILIEFIEDLYIQWQTNSLKPLTRKQYQQQQQQQFETDQDDHGLVYDPIDEENFDDEFGESDSAYDDDEINGLFGDDGSLDETGKSASSSSSEYLQQSVSISERNFNNMSPYSEYSMESHYDIDLQLLMSYVSIDDTQTTLEFLVFSAASSLEITLAQAADLISTNVGSEREWEGVGGSGREFKRE